MEDSREGKEDDEKGRRMPNSHVDDKKGKKPWYFTTFLCSDLHSDYKILKIFVKSITPCMYRTMHDTPCFNSTRSGIL